MIDLSKKEKLPRDTSFLQIEYTALRGEILKRMDVENQLMTFTVIVFGTILGVGFQNKIPFIILLYPTLSVFFSIGWAHSDYMTRLMGKYIKDQIEPVVGVDNLGWEHYLDLNRPLSYSWTARGIFITTELIAVVVGVNLAPFNATLIGLLFGQKMTNPDFIVNIILCVAFVSIIITFFTLRRITIKTSQIPIKLIQLSAGKIHK